MDEIATRHDCSAAEDERAKGRYGVATILTALAVAPIVVICCLGPAVLGGIAGWVIALQIVGAALVVAIVPPLGILVHRCKSARTAPATLRTACDGFPTDATGARQ